MSNGKGDSPRNCFTQTFRDNWDRIFSKEKASKAGTNTTLIAAEKQKGPSTRENQRPNR